MDNSLVIIFLQIFFLLAAGYLVSYVKKKASNYADKKDLRELTQIVEKEKAKYATDLSVIKAQLDIATSNKKSYREIEIEVINEFYSACNWLVYDFWNLDLTWFNSNHIEKIEEISNTVFSNLKKLTVAKGRFNLFVSDKNLSAKGYELHAACIDYSSKIHTFTSRLKTSLKNQVEFREKTFEYIKSRQNDVEREAKILSDEKNINNEVLKYTDEYMQLRKEFNNKIVIKAIVEFESSARMYLSKI